MPSSVEGKPVIRVAPNNPVFDLPVIVGIEECLFEAAGLDVGFSATYADREKDKAVQLLGEALALGEPAECLRLADGARRRRERVGGRAAERKRRGALDDSEAGGLGHRWQGSRRSEFVVAVVRPRVRRVPDPGEPARDQPVHVAQLQRAGMAKLAAVAQAARIRLRPIMMTSVATVAGHFPLTLVPGAGAAARSGQQGERKSCNDDDPAHSDRVPAVAV